MGTQKPPAKMSLVLTLAVAMYEISRDKHPEHRANMQELQRTIKNLEQQSADEEANIKA